MKESIYTIPLNESFETQDECPFCHLERMTEQRDIKYVLGPGASYMEPDVRLATDRQGFCGAHFKKMYDYGNALGCALMMQTYYACMIDEWQKQMKDFRLPDKRPLLNLGKQKAAELPLLEWTRSKGDSCYICNRIDESLSRYYSTFFVLIKDPEFREKVLSSKGFCLRHFGQMLDAAEKYRTTLKQAAGIF